jgi:uncharacterized protein
MIDRTALPSALADFGSASVAAVLIAAYLVFAEPFVGLVLHRRFEAAERRFSDARRWLYRRLLLLEWVLAALCIATVVIAPDVDLSHLGLRWPSGVLAISVSVLAVLGAAVLLMLTARLVVRSHGRAEIPGGSDSVLAMLPRSDVERRLFSLVAVTAGSCEEVVFRGFLIALVAAVLPGAPVWVCALAAAVVFGLAHAYQGAIGLTTSLLIGIALGALYVVTGSLIAPIIVHALVDLRAIPLGRLAARRTLRAT